MLIIFNPSAGGKTLSKYNFVGAIAILSDWLEKAQISINMLLTFQHFGKFKESKRFLLITIQTLQDKSYYIDCLYSEQFIYSNKIISPLDMQLSSIISVITVEQSEDAGGGASIARVCLLYIYIAIYICFVQSTCENTYRYPEDCADGP